MIRIFIIATLSLASLASSSTAFAQTPAPSSSFGQATIPINSIAIVVNNDVITQQELNDRLRLTEERMKAQGNALPSRAEFRRQVIDQMIVEQAQQQLAGDLGMRVDDATVDRALQRMAEQNHLSMQSFRDQVEKDGMPYAQFREWMREEILSQRLAEREVESKITVSESDIDHYLAAQKTNKQVQAHVRHILIKVTPTETKQQATQKLLELRQRVMNGTAKFDDLAREYSNDGTASKGGDLGWLHPGDVPEFDQTIGALKPGEVSEPIATPYGMHVLQLVETKVDEVSPERQRMMARQAIKTRKFEEAKRDWMRQLRDSAYVEIRNNDQ